MKRYTGRGKKPVSIYLCIAVFIAGVIILFRLLFPNEAMLLRETILGADAHEAFTTLGEIISGEEYYHYA